MNVCFVSYRHQGENDPSNAWIAVRDGGKLVTQVDLAAKYGLKSLSNGAVHTARIDYVPGRLDLYFDGKMVLANVPVDLARLDNGAAIDADGKAWIGFGHEPAPPGRRTTC